MPREVKLAIFILVLSAAAAVAVHSFLGKSGSSTDSPAQQFTAITHGESPTAPAAQNPGGNDVQEESKSVVCGITLDSMAALNQVAADKDFVFILLPGESKEAAQAAAKKVDEALKKISAKGVRVASFTLGKDAQDYAELVKGLSIESLPSIVALGRGCGAAVVSGEVTEAKLLRAFVLASTPSCGTPCGPSSGCGH